MSGKMYHLNLGSRRFPPPSPVFPFLLLYIIHLLFKTPAPFQPSCDRETNVALFTPHFFFLHDMIMIARLTVLAMPTAAPSASPNRLIHAPPTGIFL